MPAAAMLLARHRRRTAGLAALVMAVSLVLPFVHGVVPFERTWIHLLIPLALSTALLLDRIVPLELHPGWSVPLAVALFSFQLVRIRAALPVWEHEAFAAAGACDALRSAGALTVRQASGPLAVQVLFDHQRGRLPALQYLEPANGQWGERLGRAAMVGDPEDFHPDLGDSLIFKDEALGAIWLTTAQRGP